MQRYKRIFGNTMKARALPQQKTEAWINVSALNRIRNLGAYRSRSETQLTVHIVFDKRYFVLREQFDQRLPFLCPRASRLSGPETSS
jgi:hypothetical protein